MTNHSAVGLEDKIEGNGTQAAFSGVRVATGAQIGAVSDINVCVCTQETLSFRRSK